MSTPPHYTVVCALIERGGCVLAAQRSPRQSQANLWEFPGGKLEDGESPAVALARELREELRIDVAIGEALAPVRHDYETFSITLLPFRATLAGPAEPHPVEHAALRWCTPADCADLVWAPADRPIVAAWCAAAR